MRTINVDDHARRSESFRRYLAGVESRIVADFEDCANATMARRLLGFSADIAESEGVNGGAGAKTLTELWVNRQMWRSALKSYRLRRRIEL